MKYRVRVLTDRGAHYRDFEAESPEHATSIALGRYGGNAVSARCVGTTEECEARFQKIFNGIGEAEDKKE